MDGFFRMWRVVALVQVVLTGALAGATLGLPPLLLALFGLEVDGTGVLLMRAFGASLLFVAAAHWGARDTRSVHLVRTLCVANLLEDGTLAVLATLAVLGGTMKATGWLLAGTFAAEVLLALYVLLRARRR
ncbi:MAG TPA: hypothetical protein RMH85_14315 [Polyangiaceae bacterium LLY-WYZ-15_(1-7)]|nr:hypothetical protein [Myxococcales bacterium]MAT26723.1 hypothetical protein [Sandaracinus sp.]HJK94699.1 hypothetical protein [Polyangiaceae bacterium LLY-WYZ-15_(1-7)]MBJ72306.1 hypothetical protein [Sandaracinus sp.]HJL04672.1 hypothetical protein [Polyangiaceae bacterium LLY-WYZ-15_(1-7)]